MIPSWEEFASAIVIRAGSISVEIPGPNYLDNSLRDAIEPYRWVVSSEKRTEIDTFETNYFALSQAERDATTITLRNRSITDKNITGQISSATALTGTLTKTSLITINSVPNQDNENLRMLILTSTTDGTYFADNWNSINAGTLLEGSQTITSLNQDLERVQTDTQGGSIPVLRLNTPGTIAGDNLPKWVWGNANVPSNGVLSARPTTPPFGEGHGKSVYLAFGDGDSPTLYEFRFADLAEAANAAGWRWYSIAIELAQQLSLIHI